MSGTGAGRGGAGFHIDGVDVELGGKPVLGAVDLTVAAGEMVGLIGPSGAGKTTLLSLLNGAVTPGRGHVEIDSRDVGHLGDRDLRRLRSRVGFIYQDLRLVPNLRVYQNVLSGRFGRLSFWRSVRMFLGPGTADLAEVHALLERVGIAEKMYERTDRLSGGQAQRVAVARALYQQPRILLADEPVASVDPMRARSILRLLTDICRASGLTLCVSLHDPQLVCEFFDRVVALRDGRIVLDTPAAGITESDLAALYDLEADDGL